MKKKSALKTSYSRKLYAALFAMIGIAVFVFAASRQTRLFSFASTPSIDVNQCKLDCANLWIPDRSHQTTPQKQGYEQCKRGCETRGPISPAHGACDARWWPFRTCLICPSGYFVFHGNCRPICTQDETSSGTTCVPRLVSPTPTPKCSLKCATGYECAITPKTGAQWCKGKSGSPTVTSTDPCKRCGGSNGLTCLNTGIALCNSAYNDCTTSRDCE